jgi:asparagine synthase (glutamine-hydrolysing)
MVHSCSEPWFIVLPDYQPASVVAERVSQVVCRQLMHPSGRPWLMGCWSDEHAVVGLLGRIRVVLLGQVAIRSPELTARLRGVCRIEELDELTAGLAGSCHLMASVDGQVRIQGSLSEARRVFFAQVRGVTVAADRAHLVAWLCGASLDVRQVAARMAYGDLPYPLASAALWSGVNAVPGSSALYLDASGRSRVMRRWRPPEATLSLVEGAAAVRTALVEAVTARVRPGQVLAADLSGGLDSTSICFLAAQAAAKLLTVTLRWSASGNEDEAWAEQAAALLPGLERLVYSPQELPAYFTGVGQPTDPSDEPTAAIRDRAIQSVIAAELTARGAKARLIGHGGDHVLQATPHHLHTLLCRRPGQALRHVRGWQALRRWPAATTVRVLLDARSYDRWLSSLAKRLSGPTAMTGAPDGWGSELRLPPWASAQAVEAVASLLRENAQGTEPLAPTRGQHGRFHQAQAAGRIARHIERDTILDGVPAASPFCDDQVIEACMAVRAQETYTPWEYKPLLVAAMRGVVPATVLTRTTKDNSSAEWYAGLRTNRATLAVLAEHSYLADLGLADPDALGRNMASPEMSGLPYVALENTLACETWLRDLVAHPEPGLIRRMVAR